MRKYVVLLWLLVSFGAHAVKIEGVLVYEMGDAKSPATGIPSAILSTNSIQKNPVESQ